MKVFRHPKYYEEMRRRAKQFQKEQADKLPSSQAGEGGRVGPKATSSQAHKLTSPQAIRRQAVREPTSAECGPSHSLRGKVFHDGPQADRGSRKTHKVLRSLQEALEGG